MAGKEINAEKLQIYLNIFLEKCYSSQISKCNTTRR